MRDRLGGIALWLAFSAAVSYVWWLVPMHP